MEREQKFVIWLVIGVLILALVSMGGCDSWPPALQTQIEALRADLEDVMDDRQRLSTELAELKTTYASMERDVEEKARQHAELERRLSTMAQKERQRDSSAKAEAPQKAERSVAASVTHSSLVKGAFVPLSVTRPALRGPRVVKLQRRLRRHDLPVRVDGIYGGTTEAAVRSFQRVHGLPADGVVGPATYRALHQTGSAPTLTRQLWLQLPPLMGQDVLLIQRALRRAGHRIPVDGHYGPETNIAVTRFQRTHGLPPDGVVGPKTWHALTRPTR